VARGQSLVEFALVLPVFLFAALGFVEAAFLFSHQHSAQTSADVLADALAERIAENPDSESWHAGWNSLVAQELVRSGCDGAAFVSFPDDTHLPGDRARVTLSCEYHPVPTHGLWEGLVYAVQGEAVVRSTAVPPSSAPSLSPSP